MDAKEDVIDQLMEVEMDQGIAALPPSEDTMLQDGLDALGFDKNSRRSSLGADSVLDQDFNEEGGLLEGGGEGENNGYPTLNPLDAVLALQYADDVFNTRKDMEARFHPVNCMADQPQVTEHMRCTLVHWLIKVNQQLQFGPETVFVAVNLADRFLALTPLAQDCLQLLAVTALFLAAKMEESAIPGIRQLVTICGGTYKHHHFRRMEVLILSKLQFALHGPTTWFFLNHLALKASQLGAIDRRVLGVAKYMAETCLSSYEVTQFPPSVQAVAALQAALQLIPTPSLALTTRCLLSQLYNGAEKEEARVCSSIIARYMAPFLESLALPCCTQIPSPIPENIPHSITISSSPYITHLQHQHEHDPQDLRDLPKSPPEDQPDSEQHDLPCTESQQSTENGTPS